MVQYNMYCRGEYYIITSEGYIQRTDMPFMPSETWRLSGIALRWNSYPLNWEFIKKQLDNGEVIEGYVYDIDHGTTRMWGGSYHGHLPKAKLYANIPCRKIRLTERNFNVIAQTPKKECWICDELLKLVEKDKEGYFILETNIDDQGIKEHLRQLLEVE